MDKICEVGQLLSVNNFEELLRHWIGVVMRVVAHMEGEARGKTTPKI